MSRVPAATARRIALVSGTSRRIARGTVGAGMAAAAAACGLRLGMQDGKTTEEQQEDNDASHMRRIVSKLAAVGLS